MIARSQPRVHRFAFHREDAEDALMYPSQRLTSNESLQRPTAVVSQSRNP
jgi:hypothetical protein